MIRLTPAQLLTAIGALAFLFVQVMVLEMLSASTERSANTERIAALEAKDAAKQEQIDSLKRQFERLGDFVVLKAYSPREHRDHSAGTPPPPEL